MIKSMDAALEVIFATRRRLDATPRGLDEYTRDVAPSRQLLAREHLLTAQREYAVVTGSRGKGSVTAIMAKLLEALGYRVGAVTSPHLVHWNERIRVNGRMIPTVDFLRILNNFLPSIEAITAGLTGTQYLSPQGIFLAIALRHFDELGVDMAVLEVGRGGRFDDVAVVPNALSVFTPIMLEHTALLGDSIERIAWHKAGIIKRGGRALSLPQAPAVIGVLQAECDQLGAQLLHLRESERATWVSDRVDGQLIHLESYGELDLPLLGRYQIDNAALAVRAVELMARPSRPSDTAWKLAIQGGLHKVNWLGRVQKLADRPATYVDGAITVSSAASFIASVMPRLRQPVVSIVGVPRDRDYVAVYKVMAAASQALIITETDINPSTRFPARQEAIAAAQGLTNSLQYADDLPTALALARELTGCDGTILLAVSLMLVGESMLIWNIDTSAI